MSLDLSGSPSSLNLEYTDAVLRKRDPTPKGSSQPTARCMHIAGRRLGLGHGSGFVEPSADCPRASCVAFNAIVKTLVSDCDIHPGASFWLAATLSVSRWASDLFGCPSLTRTSALAALKTAHTFARRRVKATDADDIREMGMRLLTYHRNRHQGRPRCDPRA